MSVRLILFYFGILHGKKVLLVPATGSPLKSTLFYGSDFNEIEIKIRNFLLLNFSFDLKIDSHSPWISCKIVKEKLFICTCNWWIPQIPQVAQLPIGYNLNLPIVGIPIFLVSIWNRFHSKELHKKGHEIHLLLSEEWARMKDYASVYTNDSFYTFYKYSC